MPQPWRLLVMGSADAFTNMAIDEAILQHVAGGESPPTLRFYGWRPSAVSIGYFQGIELEVDLDVCHTRGVDVIRRLTGGGAVYHDTEGEVTYSLAVAESYAGIPNRVLDSYAFLCSGLVVGLGLLGIAAEFRPINDITAGEKKISGNAQTRRFGGILQHGTLLCEVDPQLMFTLLKVPNEKFRDKLIQGVEERVTSIKREIGEVDRERIVDALVRGFSQALGVEFESGALKDAELALAAKLRTERYATHAWNHKR